MGLVEEMLGEMLLSADKDVHETVFSPGSPEEAGAIGNPHGYEPWKYRSMSYKPKHSAIPPTVKHQPRSTGPQCSKTVFENFGGLFLADDLLLEIFSGVREQELCRLAQVCHRFYNIANSPELWKRLYREVFEYDLPLLVGSDPREFYFVQTSTDDSKQSGHSALGTSKQSTDVFPGVQIGEWLDVQIPKDEKDHKWSLRSWSSGSSLSEWSTGSPEEADNVSLDTESDLKTQIENLNNEYGRASSLSSSRSRCTSFASDDVHFNQNVWKKSFMELYRAVHVRPGYKNGNKCGGRATKYFDRIEAALAWSQKQRIDPDNIPLILIHPGTYDREFLTVKSPVILLGCGPGPNPAEAVIIDQHCDNSYIDFNEWSDSSYLGYVTLRTSHKEKSKKAEPFWYCIAIETDTIIDHCILRSFKGSGVYVSNRAAPRIRCCDISYCKGVGIFISDSPGGLYEENRFTRNGIAALSWRRSADPVYLRNTFQDCKRELLIFPDQD